MIPTESRPNRWTLDRDRLTLVLHDDRGRTLYEADLKECVTPKQALDWIFRVGGKAWATERIVADLVRALNDVLDVQVNLCPGGIVKRIHDVRTVIAGRDILPVSRIEG